MQRNTLKLFFILIIIILFSPGSKAAWQNIGGDLQHTGYVQTSSIPLELIWKYKVGGPDISGAVIEDRTLFIGSDDKKIYAIDATSGELRWSYPVFGKVYTPAAKSGMVFAASFDNYIYALDFNGNLKWTHNTGSSISSPPVVYDNRLYGGFDRNIYAIFISNGSLNWKYTTDGIIESTPSIAQGVVYVGSNDNNLYALDAENKDLIWKYSTQGSLSSSPSVIKGNVLIGSKDTGVYAIDSKDGELRWSEKTGDWVTSSPAIFQNSVYIGSDDNMLYSFNIDSGDVIWKFKTGDRIESNPVATNDLVYAGSMDGSIYALTHDGTLANKYTLGSGIKSLSLSENILFAVSYDGYIYAFGTAEKTDTLLAELPDTIPPELKISPVPLNTTSENLIISGIARDPSGILVVTVNGIKAGTDNWNASLRLINGSNTIIIVAIDKEGNINTQKRTVTYINQSISRDVRKNPGFNFIYNIIGFFVVLYILRYRHKS